MGTIDSQQVLIGGRVDNDRLANSNDSQQQVPGWGTMVWLVDFPDDFGHCPSGSFWDLGNSVTRMQKPGHPDSETLSLRYKP